MPKGPNGQKRPADAIGLAIMVGRIATGEIEEKTKEPATAARQRAGVIGGATRAAKLTPSERSSIAKKAATTRWGKSKVGPT